MSIRYADDRGEPPTDKDRAWFESDLSHLGEFEPYEWAEGELDDGIPVRYVLGLGLVIEGTRRYDDSSR